MTLIGASNASIEAIELTRIRKKDKNIVRSQKEKNNVVHRLTAYVIDRLKDSMNDPLEQT